MIFATPVRRFYSSREGIRELVMETLGHSQISLTMNTYSRVLPVLQ